MSKQPNQNQTNGLSYAAAGVDIEQGNALVERIKPRAQATARAGMLGGLGGFGGLFDPQAAGFKDPIMVSATDGVGTKLLLAIEHGRHETIGIDLVAMCVNDIIVQGAEPLWFLDYFATGALDVATAQTVIHGIADGCELAGAALLGGETAEMPGMYPAGHYDLAGFCVGAVERDDLLTPDKVTAGDRLLGLASSGVHANGYSLVRAILDHSQAPLDLELDSSPLLDQLMSPTRIYVKSVLPTVRSGAVHGIAHITGGGLTENLPRILPDNTHAVVDLGCWPRPAVFQWLQEQGQVSDSEMLRTFNCGIGMVVAVAEAQSSAIKDSLQQAGEVVFDIGSVEAGEKVTQFTGEPRV